METLINIKNLTKTYEGHPVLSNLSFQVFTGEILVIVGPSGIGKSTLLNILSGLDTDYSGRITYAKDMFDGIRIARPIVFQEFDQLLPWYSVEKNILLPYKRKHLSDTDRELIDFVGLSDHLHKRPSALSGGMKQRTAIARCLVSDSKIIFMDEPFGSLDEERRFQLQELIIDINKRFNRTIVFITHDMAEARRIGDRVLRLNEDGRMEIMMQSKKMNLD